MTRIFKNKYLYLLFIIPFILLILNKNIKTDLSEIKKCNLLDFEQASLLHPNNFAPLQIYISGSPTTSFFAHVVSPFYA